ncbi:hypothetical protein ABS766_09835 [Flavobacterium sp. ST-119]|uniref:Uncharacterized protein n=2 Tax=Flavobacterium rhizosphaerae TaxID=3163298 RepID=A0ABW8YZZ1_9FLAO
MSRMFDMFNNTRQEIWDLFKNPEVSIIDRIVLGSTFDNVVVLRKDIPKLLEAYRAFEADTSLPQQADEIENLYNSDEEFIAIAWNQTSVNCDVWISPDFNDLDEDECRKPYNISKHTDHWDLFQSPSLIS